MNNTMKLEQQVTSLELSKKLRELGVEQKSLFYWVNEPNGGLNTNGYAWFLRGDLRTRHASYVYVSAFTVAELGEMLPSYYYSYKKMSDGRYWCIKEDVNNECECCGLFFGEQVDSTDAETEADARAKCLIWLIEEGYITQ